MLASTATYVFENLAPRPGFEPGTFRLGGGRSIQLSYRGNVAILGKIGINRNCRILGLLAVRRHAHTVLRLPALGLLLAAALTGARPARAWWLQAEIWHPVDAVPESGGRCCQVVVEYCLRPPQGGARAAATARRYQ